MKGKSKHKNCYMIDFLDVTKEGSSFIRGSLDTLGQIGTKRFNKPTLELSGLGSCLEDKSRLIARARRKHISFVIISELIKRAQENGDQELEKYFTIASRCLNDVVISDNRLFGRYCRSRACLVCNGIRKANMINQYLPSIKTWEEPYFVTLTIKSCYAKDLDNLMEEMKTNFKKLLERLKKRYLRDKGHQIVGIKSLECNFNATERTYNPHFHLIVKNREVKKAIIVEWLRIWGKDKAGPWGQHNRRVEKLETDLIELIKYGSKIFTEPNPNAKDKKKASRYVYISALYNIYSSMRGLRIFDRFGFQKAEGCNKKDNVITKVSNFDTYTYFPKNLDWINEETGELLSGFTPDQKLKGLLNHRVNTILE